MRGYTYEFVDENELEEIEVEISGADRLRSVGEDMLKDSDIVYI